MSLPTYDKSKRRKSFEQLPKDCYVIKILNAKEAANKTSGSRLDISFDIAEGEFKDFYMQQYRNNSNEDKKWPNDAIFRINIPSDGSPQYVWDSWNTFFADLEDSNNGFVFAGDPATLKNKIVGGKFHIEQTEYNSKIYNHTRMRWTCVAADVRSGKAAKTMPNDKLLAPAKAPASVDSDFIDVPAGSPEELPWD